MKQHLQEAERMGGRKLVLKILQSFKLLVSPHFYEEVARDWQEQEEVEQDNGNGEITSTPAV